MRHHTRHHKFSINTVLGRALSFALLASALCLVSSGASAAPEAFKNLAAKAEKDHGAFVQLQNAANQGQPEAQYYLGKLYENGTGVAKNAKMSFQLFKKAVAQGYVPAKADLGAMYATGADAPLNYQKAFELETEAARTGNLEAQRLLGILYQFGHGVKQDNEKAAIWYSKAAEQGDGFGEYLLATMYLKGQGVSRDLHKARAWFQKAANQNVGDAKAQLAKLASMGPEYDPVVKFPFANWQDSLGRDRVSNFDISGVKPGMDFATANAILDKRRAQGGLPKDVRISLGALSPTPTMIHIPSGRFCPTYDVAYRPNAPTSTLYFAIGSACDASSRHLAMVRYSQPMVSKGSQYVDRLIHKYGKPDFEYVDPKNGQIFSLLWGYKANAGVGAYTLAKSWTQNWKPSNAGYFSLDNLVSLLLQSPAYVRQAAPDSKCVALMKQKKQDRQPYQEDHGIDDAVFNCFTATMKAQMTVAMTKLKPIMLANSTTDGTLHIYLASPALSAMEQIYNEYLGTGEMNGPMHRWLTHRAYEAKMNSKAKTSF